MYWLNKLLPKEPYLRQLLIIGFVVNIIVFGLLGIAYRFLPPQIPLFYSYPWGREQLANTYLLMLPMSISIFFSIFNLFLSQKISGLAGFVTQTLTIGSILGLFLSAITTLRIILLVS